MANRGKCCDICGDSGTLEALVTCSRCNDSHQHLYCMHTDIVQLKPPETWFCEDCSPKKEKPSKKPTAYTTEKPQSEIIRRRNYVESLKNANSNSKIKLLSQEEAIDLGEGASYQHLLVVKRSVSRSASLKNNAAAPALQLSHVSRGYDSEGQRQHSASLKNNAAAPTLHLQHVSRGNDSEYQRQNSRSILKTPLLEHKQKEQTRAAKRDANGTKLVLGKSRLSISSAADKEKYPSCSQLDKGKAPMGAPSAAKNNGQLNGRTGSAVSRGIVLQRARAPVRRIPSAAASWSGSCRLYNASQQLEAIHKLKAHPSSRVLKKVYEFSKSMPHHLQFELTPRCDIRVDIDQHLCWDRRDIALYFFPVNKSRQNSYDELVKLMGTKDYALRTRIDRMELLIFTSRVLNSNCQEWRGRHFLWGLFRKVGQPPQKEVDMSEDMDIDMVGGEDIPGKQDRVLALPPPPPPPPPSMLWRVKDEGEDIPGKQDRVLALPPPPPPSVLRRVKEERF